MPCDRVLPVLQAEHARAEVADGEDVAALQYDYQDMYDNDGSPRDRASDDTKISSLLNMRSRVWALPACTTCGKAL